MVGGPWPADACLETFGRGGESRFELVRSGISRSKFPVMAMQVWSSGLPGDAPPPTQIDTASMDRLAGVAAGTSRFGSNAIVYTIY